VHQILRKSGRYKFRFCGRLLDRCGW
jgi:hypothetical protein